MAHYPKGPSFAAGMSPSQPRSGWSRVGWDPSPGWLGSGISDLKTTTVVARKRHLYLPQTHNQKQNGGGVLLCPWWGNQKSGCTHLQSNRGHLPWGSKHLTTGLLEQRCTARL